MVTSHERRRSLGWLTGDDGFVIRGGYSRTHDYAFLNIALNIVSSFPYVAAINRSNLANAFTLLQSTPAGVPPVTTPTRSLVRWWPRTSVLPATTNSALAQSDSSGRTSPSGWAMWNLRQGSLPNARRQPAAAVQHAAPGSDAWCYQAPGERGRVVVPLAADTTR